MPAARPSLPPITRVLVASDLQHGSSAVLHAAASIARMTGASLHAVHVFTPAAVPRARRAADPDVEEDVLDEARRGLSVQLAPLADAGVEVASAVVLRKRSIYEGVVEVARASAADLVVIGAHARSQTASRLGSTADRVVRSVSVPCLVVRGEATFPIHRAAVLTDFSADARAGLGLALSWLPSLGLADPEARLDVLHVAWPETPDDAGGAPAWMVRRVQQEIDRAAAGVHQPPPRVEPRVVFSAYPADAAIEEARARRHQLLVVASRGRGPVARALIGSVALGVLHAAPCPVLLVPHGRPKR